VTDFCARRKTHVGQGRISALTITERLARMVIARVENSIGTATDALDARKKEKPPKKSAAHANNTAI
jgi:hypothetical protein